MEFKFPIGLKLEAQELPDGNWKLLYQEYFRPEDLEAFRLSLQIMEKSSEALGLEVELDEDNHVVTVKYTGPRGRVFDYLCGEFIGLSNIAQVTLLELFVIAGLRKMKESMKNV